MADLVGVVSGFVAGITQNQHLPSFTNSRKNSSVNISIQIEFDPAGPTP